MKDWKVYVVLALYLSVSSCAQAVIDEATGVRVTGPFFWKAIHHSVRQLVGIGFVLIYLYAKG